MVNAVGRLNPLVAATPVEAIGAAALSVDDLQVLARAALQHPIPDTAMTVVAKAAADAATRQDGLGPLMADLAQAAEATDLPRPVRAAAAEVLRLQTPLQADLDAPALKQAVAQSGLFLEARLAAAPEAPLGPDLKAALLVLRQVLTAATPPPTESTAAAPATPTTPATPAAAPTAAAPTAPDAPGVSTPAATPQTATASLPQPARTAVSPVAPAAAQTPMETPEPVMGARPMVAPTVLNPAAYTAAPAPTPPVQVAPREPAQVAARPAVAPATNAPANTAAAQTAAQAALIMTSELEPPAPPSTPRPQVGYPAATLNPPSPADPPDDPQAPRAHEVPPPPFPGAQSKPQRPSIPSLPADASTPTVTARLMQQTTAALAREELLQIASMPDAGAARETAQQARTESARWMVDIPFATPQGPAVIPFEISRDGEGLGPDGHQTMAWRARFSVDLEPLGPVHAALTLSGDRVAVSLWAERPESAAQLRGGLSHLDEALRPVATNIDLTVYPGAPPYRAPSPGRLVDQAS